MTIDEKREALVGYCAQHGCADCLLNFPMCRCSRGYSFKSTPIEENFITDAEVIGAYDEAFQQESTLLEASIAQPEKVNINGNVTNLTINFFTQEE